MHNGRRLDSVVFAPSCIAGGVKSLYTACEALARLGRSSVAPVSASGLATWFQHSCAAYDYSYVPDLIVYPEVWQPNIDGVFRVCFALGKHAEVLPHANLVVCRSLDVLTWVKRHSPATAATLLLPSVNRGVFQYDGRPKARVISCMPRENKHPETAQLLRERYGPAVVEIINCAETDVAAKLKSAKVFVHRGDDKEGSPRPPKEALLAGCFVVGLENELKREHHNDFGIRCKGISELIEEAGKALDKELPAIDERNSVRDSEDERRDWLTIIDDFFTSARTPITRPKLC